MVSVHYSRHSEAVSRFIEMRGAWKVMASTGFTHGLRNVAKTGHIHAYFRDQDRVSGHTQCSQVEYQSMGMRTLLKYSAMGQIKGSFSAVYFLLLIMMVMTIAIRTGSTSEWYHALLLFLGRD